MVAIPPPTDTIPQRIFTALEAVKQKPRPHLGGSLIGHPCDRWLWLSFRWVVFEPFPGRVLRLFRRGHLEEHQVVFDLRAAGLTVHEYDQKTRRQFTITDGHFGGSLDGIVTGVPEAPNKMHVLEIKTHALKSFKELVAQGVQASKPMHYAQMQVYMLKRNIDRALYFAVCKDDDQLHVERVRLDKDFALALVAKAHRITTSERIPEPISGDPTWFQCKWCAAHSFCHEKQPTKEANCRTCSHVTAKPDGTWHCARWDATIPDLEAQIAGCDDHVLHPDMVPWQMQPSEDGLTATWIIDGKPVLNTSKPEGFKSREIVANPSACTGHPMIDEVRRVFPGAEVVG